MSNSRVIIPFALVLFSFNLALGDDTLIPSFQNSWLKVYPAGILQSKPTDRGLLKIPFGSVPDGKLQRTDPPECSSLELEREMIGKDPKAIQAFMDRCGKTLSRFASGKYTSVIDMAEGNYPLGGRPYLKELVFSLPYNIVVHGLLALKDPDRKRPLVIFNCGTGCNLSDGSARMFLAEIFDQSPFNVLILPSLSGSDFIKDNHGFGLGGFEEGRLIFEIVNLLGGADSPISNLITSFHVLGVSLGGNGSLFAGIYGSYNNSILTGPKIQSITGYCPVVDLRQSFEDLDRKDLTGRYFTSIIKNTIIKNFVTVFGSSHDLPDLYKPGHNQSVPFIEKYVLPSYQALSKSPGFNLPPFTEFDFSSGDAFWKANNYLNYYSAVKIPTLLVYSKDDFIVYPQHNAKKLEEELENNPNPNVSVVHLDKGSHCAAMEVYGQDILTGIVQNFVLNHSPEFDYNSGKKSLNLTGLPGSEHLKLQYTGEKFFGYRWETKSGSLDATLDLSIWAPYQKVSDNYLCSEHDPYYAFEGCFRHIEIKVPLQNFFPTLNRSVNSKEEGQALTRWLNVRVRSFSQNESESIDTLTPPDHIEWTLD